MTKECAACSEHYGDTQGCDEGKPVASPHRTPRFVLVEPGASAENTSGNIGEVGLDNVYLCAYANYGQHPHPRTLHLGQRTQAVFRLGGVGTYDVVRVR